MTRDYNKQRRDDARPFSQNRYAGRQRDEQSPRAPRTRPNRASVDRAWESGAPSNHADYRSRGSYTQPTRNNWRHNQSSEHSSAPHGRKQFGSREENYRRTERPFNGYSDSRPRSFESGRRSFDGNRTQEPRRYSDGPRGNGDRPAFRNNRQSRPYEQRSQYRSYDQGRGYQQRDGERFDRQPRDFGPNNRPPRSFERPHRESRPTHSFERPTRNFDRDDRPPRNFERRPRDFNQNDGYPRSASRNDRQAYDAPRPGTSNSRWQSRPAFQRGNAYRDNRERREQPEVNRPAPQHEQFEGDYERFDAPENRRQHAEHSFRDHAGHDRQPEQPEERNVTRLPDGRVLKGPRSVQRRNAAFWTGVSQEAENLVEQVDAKPAAEAVDQPAAENEAQELADVSSSTQPTVEEAAPLAPRKTRTHAASAVIREKKAGSKRGPARVKERSSGPKPSRRGFKWPTP